MSYKITYELNGKTNYIMITGSHDEVLEKAFEYLEDMGVYDALIEEM